MGAGVALTGGRTMVTGGADLTTGIGGALRVTGAGAMLVVVGPILSFSSSCLQYALVQHT